MNEDDSGTPSAVPLELLTKEQRNLLTGDMEQDFHLWDQAMTELRSSRNTQNALTKSYIEERKGCNLVVKTKTGQLQKFKSRRDDLNRATRLAKEGRDILTTELKSLREKINEVQNQSGEIKLGIQAELDAIMSAQSEAHEQVKQMAADAQAKHDEMKKLSQEIELIREEGNQAHHKLTESKKIADEQHQQLILLLQHTSEYRGEVENDSQREQLDRLEALPKLIDNEIEILTLEFYSDLIEQNGLEFTVRIGSDLDKTKLEPIEYLMKNRVIRILTDNSGPFIGKGGKHIDEFRKVLTDKYSLPLEVKVRAPYNV
jgi:chromosome segregation ATPase